MDINTTLVVGAAIWFGAGLVAALFMMRRGHRHWYWILVAIGLGPFALPVLMEVVEGDRTSFEELTTGEQGDGLHVVVAVDGSPTALAAAAWAGTSLGDQVGRITLVSVVDHDASDERAERAVEWLERAAAVLDGPAPRTMVVRGEPVAALIDLVEREDVDLLVVGPRGAGAREALLGSVASGLVQRAPCAVVVARTSRNVVS